MHACRHVARSYVLVVTTTPACRHACMQSTGGTAGASVYHDRLFYFSRDVVPLPCDLIRPCACMPCPRAGQLGLSRRATAKGSFFIFFYFFTENDDRGRSSRACMHGGTYEHACSLAFAPFAFLIGTTYANTVAVCGRYRALLCTAFPLPGRG